MGQINIVNIRHGQEQIDITVRMGKKMKNPYFNYLDIDLYPVCYWYTRGPQWPCNAHLSIIALIEPDLEMIKASILTKIHDDYINK